MKTKKLMTTPLAKFIGPLLRALNDSFTLIIDSADTVNPFGFKVVKPNNASSDVFRDLQFIYDFVQKTVILCLARFPDDDKFEGQIDIAKFANLRTLELQRVRVKQVSESNSSIISCCDKNF